VEGVTLVPPAGRWGVLLRKYRRPWALRRPGPVSGVTRDWADGGSGIKDSPAMEKAARKAALLSTF
jgi:hypothetical protein